MGNIFSGSEIVEIGVQIEKNGYDFYHSLTDQSKSSKAKELFEFLADEEKRHIKTFQKILDGLEGYQPAESYPGEYFAYMSALAEGYVFTKEGKGSEIAKKVTNDKEAINLGAGFEKDSIVFYQGMKKVVPKDDLKVVDQLIAQEQNHLKILLELKDNL